ncbi:hypothetical protein KGP36_01690 [Patescibacteria group bacterium]|nr:hypothetical protein [Patescibacteria group bacterium]
MTNNMPDNGFPLTTPPSGAPQEYGSCESIDPFSEQATPTVAEAQEPWYEDAAEEEAHEPMHGTPNGEDFFEGIGG